MKKKYLFLFSTLLLAGCGGGSTTVNNSSSLSSAGSESTQVSSNQNSSEVSSNEASSKVEETSIVSSAISVVTPGEYDASKNTVIHLGEACSVENNNGGVFIEGSIITIATAGTYDISGTLANGQIVVQALDTDKVNINLLGINISCNNGCPFLMLSADKCSISSKSGTTNVINDNRADESELYTGAVYAMCDLDLKGNGNLEVNSIANNGIHTKDDLNIKNVTLSVKCPNNAIKGNDSLTIESGNIIAISTKGDCLKTSNSNISSKGNQRGTITILGGTLNLYAACDCIDAAYDVVINNNPVINCFSDKYSTYSEEVSVVASKVMYLKTNTSSLYNNRLAVYYTLDDETTVWVDAKEANSPGGSRSKYFKLDMPSNAKYLQVFSFTSSQTTNSLSEYQYASERLSINASNDCISLTLSSTKINCSWTNYASSGGPGGPGGMVDGNPDKAEYSCKGIKADNKIDITGGNINIKTHDDAIHASMDKKLENEEYGLGNVNISGGNIVIISDDDGVHADNELNITGGFVDIQKSYEGVEGFKITFDGGETRIVSSDDGVNAAGSTSQGDSNLYIKSGILYVNADGDGLDSNGYISMSGGYVVAEGPTNGGNGVLDYDRTFTFTGGYLLAIGCSGMNQKATASGTNVTSSSKSISTTTSSYVKMTVDSQTKAIIKVNKSNQNYCAYAFEGSTGSVDVTTSITETLVDNLYFIA